MSFNKLTTSLLAMAASANAIRISQNNYDTVDGAYAIEALSEVLADVVLYSHKDADPNANPRFVTLDQDDNLLRTEIHQLLATGLTADEEALKARVIREVCPDYIDETSACDGFGPRGPDGSIADMLFDYLRSTEYHADASDRIEEKLT